MGPGPVGVCLLVLDAGLPRGFRMFPMKSEPEKVYRPCRVRGFDVIPDQIVGRTRPDSSIRSEQQRVSFLYLCSGQQPVFFSVYDVWMVWQRRITVFIASIKNERR